MGKPKRFKLGKPVTVTCSFDGAPSEVFFAFIRAGHPPVVDSGSEHWGTSLVRHGLTYSYTIDTTGFESGPVQWRMWSEGDFVDSTIDRFILENDDPEHTSALESARELTQSAVVSRRLASALDSYMDNDAALRRAVQGFAGSGLVQSKSSYDLLGSEPPSTGALKHVVIGFVIGLIVAVLIGDRS